MSLRLQLAGWALVIAGTVLVALVAGCGDDWPKAITIGVDVGRPTCVVVDGGVERVDCDGGIQ